MILAKKGTKNFATPYLIPFQSVSHENKALHNFHKSGLHPVVRCIKSLAWDLDTHFIENWFLQAWL